MLDQGLKDFGSGLPGFEVRVWEILDQGWFFMDLDPLKHINSCWLHAKGNFNPILQMEAQVIQIAVLGLSLLSLQIQEKSLDLLQIVEKSYPPTIFIEAQFLEAMIY